MTGKFNFVNFLEGKGLKTHKLLSMPIISSAFSAMGDDWKRKNIENESHRIKSFHQEHLPANSAESQSLKMYTKSDL